MAHTSILSSYIWGLMTETVALGDGYGSGPSVSMAVVGDPNTVRVLFDRAMMQDGYLLRTDNYTITKDGYSILLPVFRVLLVPGRQDAVDLVVQDQESVLYDLVVGAVGAEAQIRDSYGNVLVSGAASFTGLAPSFPTYSDLFMFTGFEAGMDAYVETAWMPDRDPPYLANRNPAPGQIDVVATVTINLDVLDLVSGVDESTVRIDVNGVLAWASGVAQPGFTVFEIPVPQGYRYLIQRPTPFVGFSTVTIGVVASDLAAIPNTLSTAYSFKIIGDSATPFLRYRSPGPEELSVAPSTSWSFDLLDDYSGVALETIELYVNGVQAYEGATSSWLAPFSGAVVKVHDVDGYDGYFIRIDHPVSPASSRIDIRVVADDEQSNHLDTTYGFWIAPAAIAATFYPYEITLRIVFSGEMDTSTLLDASLYRFPGGGYTRLVELLAPNEVLLYVERLQGNPVTMSVSNRIADIRGGHPIETDLFVIPEFQSTALFSNTDGLVRTWHRSREIAKDSQRIYLSSSRGIDVLDIRNGVRNASRWAHVLNFYGTDAFCLAETLDGYRFQESDPPQIVDQSPAPGSLVPSPAVIAFSFEDNNTSVEPTSLIVYVNGQLAFTGASAGWQNGWGGQISIDTHRLDVQLFPPTAFVPGATVVVRAMARDFFGNPADKVYNFAIAP